MRAAMFVLVAGLTVPSAGARADDPPKIWEFTGQTQADVVEVRPRATGYLTRIAVREGDAVAKGDVLAEIDPREHQLELDAARARLKSAEARLQVARVKVASVTSLMEKRVISQAEVDLETAAADEAEAALLIAKVEVQRAELILSWTRVVAPSNGRVSRIQTTEGSLAIADQTHLLTVVATEPMYVTFHVPEALLLQLRRDGLCEPGKLSVAVGFGTDEGHPHSADLDLVDPEVDPKTGSARFRALIPNPKGFLLPGMSARVRLSPSAT